jgi:hypothetical protein
MYIKITNKLYSAHQHKKTEYKMFIRKVAILSLGIVYMMIPSVHGIKPHLRKTSADTEPTIMDQQPDMSLNNSVGIIDEYDMKGTVDESDLIYDDGQDKDPDSLRATSGLDSLKSESFPSSDVERTLQWGRQGDWTLCGTSSQCASGCCTAKYSWGTPKCTPLKSGFNPKDNECITKTCYGRDQQCTCRGYTGGEGRSCAMGMHTHGFCELCCSGYWNQREIGGRNRCY